MSKPSRFATRHIKIEIRPPDEKKHLDLDDEFDRKEAMKIIFREWLEIQADVSSFFNVVKIDEDNSKKALKDLNLP
ncbi:MAG TPA: hypothetical protein VL854_06750 [Nitrososphaeraceae archaeon]|nr:hypothetical protein [Nitrososphaeraceae archaeon]